MLCSKREERIAYGLWLEVKWRTEWQLWGKSVGAAVATCRQGKGWVNKILGYSDGTWGIWWKAKLGGCSEGRGEVTMEVRKKRLLISCLICMETNGEDWIQWSRWCGGEVGKVGGVEQ